MTYVNFIDRATGEVFSYDMDDESQVLAIRPGLEELSAEEVAAIRAAQEEAQAPTPEQILESANERRDDLLAKASIRISPLQFAVDIGEATKEEEAQLLSWKTYLLSVSRVNKQDGFPSAIEWPEEPV